MAPRIMMWLPVVGFPAYEVSEYGNVRRCQSGPNGRTNRFVGKELHQRLHNSNMRYWYVGLRTPGGRQGKKVNKLVHQLVAEAFHGPRPSVYHEVAHADGDIDNNHYTNVDWQLKVENLADRSKHGRLRYGESNPSWKHGFYARGSECHLG